MVWCGRREVEESEGEEAAPQLRASEQACGVNSEHPTNSLTSIMTAAAAAAGSKSGGMGTGTKAALLVLALWSLISLVVIVVWSTSPDLKSSARCRQDLRQSHEKMLGAEALWARDKDELERRLAEAHERLERREAALALLDGRLRLVNQSLDACVAREVMRAIARPRARAIRGEKKCCGFPLHKRVVAHLGNEICKSLQRVPVGGKC